MGINSLRDLFLAGVKWELTENLNGPAPTENIKSDNPIIMSQTTIVPPVAPINTDAAVKGAAMAAKKATDFDSLNSAIQNTAHPLQRLSKNTVLPNLTSKSLMIITDFPSVDDDDSGQLLTGAAGQLLDKMLGAIGMNRAGISMIPLVFWRPPGGRTPTDEELEISRPFVHRAIELAEPTAILTLGTLAAFEIAGAKLPAGHGKPAELKPNDTDSAIRVIPIFHPNYMLLKPEAKKPVWEALQNL